MPTEYDLQYDFFLVDKHRRDANYSMNKMHYHTSHELMIIESGETNFMIHDKLYKLKRGDVALVPKNILHKNNGGSAHVRYVVNFSDDYLEKYYSHDAVRQLMKCFHTHKLTLSETVFENVLFVVNLLNNENEYGFVLIADLLAHLCMATDETDTEEKLKSNEQLDMLLEYINTHYAEITGLDYIADAVHFSKSYICQLIKRTTGMTISEYLNGVRIKKACELLHDGVMNISEVAAACGFDSASYFGKVFRKTVKMTPMQFKKIAADNAVPISRDFR